MDLKELFNKLVFVLPEIQLDEKIMATAISRGWVQQTDWEEFIHVRREARRIANITSRLSGKSALQRIMLLAPEIMSRDTVDMLRGFDLIDIPTGHALRAGLSAIGAVHASAVSEKDIASRIFTLVDGVNSEDLISLMRNLDEDKIEGIRRAFLRGRMGQMWGSAWADHIDDARLSRDEAEFVHAKIRESIKRAEMLRDMARAGKATNDAVRSALEVHRVWDAVTIFAHTIFGEEFLRAAVHTGVISASKFDTISAVEKMGLNIWRKTSKAVEYDSWYARGLLMSEGILSSETIAVAKQLGWIDDTMARNLNWSANAIRSITRRSLANFTAGRRYRVTPGETPLQTYARVARVTDKHLINLLNEAAKESRAAAELAMKKAQVGSLTRAAQQNLVAREMHKEMRSLGERMGPLIIFGERDVAVAAQDSMDFLQTRLLGRLTEEDRLSLRLTARSGLDSMVSRAENRQKLSRAVYRNMKSWNGQMDREINIALLRGLSPREFAKRVEGMIRPDTPGGVSYAAMRLARTEINNAFHWSQIRYTREMPWVEGFLWNLSGSHGKPDICNFMANEDHSRMGPGVYKKSEVPGKPHPHCLCYVTPVTKKPGEFEKQLLRGSYNRYLQTMRRNGLFDDPYAEAADSVVGQFGKYVLPTVKMQVRRGAMDLGGSLVIAALRNPSAAKAFVQNAINGYGALAQRFNMPYANSITKTKVTKEWLEDSAQLGAHADDLVKKTDDVVDGTDIDLSSFKAYEGTNLVEFDVKAVVSGLDDEVLDSILSEFELGVGGESRSEMIDLVIDGFQGDSVGTIMQVLENAGVDTSRILGTDSLGRAAFGRLTETLDIALSENAEAGFAHSMYAGTMTYMPTNILLRQASGDFIQFAETINDLMDEHGLGQIVQKYAQGLLKAADMTDMRAAQDFLGHLKADTDMAIMAAEDAKTATGVRSLWPFEFARTAVSRMHWSGIADEFASGDSTFGEIFARGLRDLGGLGELPQDTILYRSTDYKWLGINSADEVEGMVGKVFTDWGMISTEGIPNYYTQTTEWYSTVRTRIHIPEGTKVGIGAADEDEIILAPGTRFMVTRTKLSDLLNEDGIPIWDVDVLALPPQQ